MRGFRRATQVVSLLLVATHPSVAALPQPEDAQDLPITVRIFDYSGLSQRKLAMALVEATTILQAAGITVGWLHCLNEDPQGISDDACRRPLGPDGFGLRILATPPRRGGKLSRQTLGYAAVDSTARSGVLASVFVGRVVALAAEGAVDYVKLLGRVIAHEIGHLLLDTSGHSGRGLMRAAWSGSEVRQGADERWFFSEEDGARMRARLQARSRQSVARGSPLGAAR